MRSWMICYITGIFCAAWQPQLFSLLPTILIAIASIVLSLFCRKRIAINVTFFLLGFAWLTLWGHWQLSHRMPEALLKQSFVVKGVVEGIPKYKQGVTVFSLSVSTISSADSETLLINNDQHLSSGFKSERFIPRKLRLSWYEPTSHIKPKQKLTLKVKLKPPHSLINPSGFDYERWLLSRGYDATGYLQQVINVQNSETGLSASQLRVNVAESIGQRYPAGRISALLNALTTGQKQGFSEQDWLQLRHTGTVHLAVISGLHIGFMGLVGWFVAITLSRFLSAMMPYHTATIGALIFAGGYLILAGMEIPALRAFIMLSVFLLSGWRMVYLTTWDRWWLALVIILTLFPLSLFEKGFWLSFTAVALLIFLAGQLKHWSQLIKLQWQLLVGMLPLYLLFFNGVSLMAPLINLLLIPLVSLLVPLLMLDTLLGFIAIDWLQPVVLLGAKLFWWLLDQTSTVSWGFVTLPVSQWWQVMLIICAALVLLGPAIFAPRWFALFLLLPILVGHKTLRDKPHMTAWLYDVGQGLAVRIESGDYQLFYDLGTRYKSGSSAFTRAVQPDLADQGITGVDHLIISHDDRDHSGGYSHFVSEFSARQVISSFAIKGKESTRCIAGQKWKTDEVTFTMLAGSSGENDNERSCVLFVATPYCSLLLPGDIGFSKENGLPVVTDDLTWLVASHHGSRFSTGDNLLLSWNPKWVLFSAGYGNPFKHPHPDVLNRVSKIGGQTLNTANSGAIRLESSAKGECKTNWQRKTIKRFWR